MTNEDFKKLDQLMERNVPTVSKSISLKPIVAPKTRSWPGFVLSLGLCSLVAFFVFRNNYQNNIINEEAIEEILAWDVTSDEFTEDFEVTLAMLD